MRKFIMVSILALSFISAAQAAPILKDGKEIISKHPLAVEYRSKEYGGTKDAIDAYSDGVGVYVGTVNPDKRVNQAPMAELVEKYGESAKAKGVMVAEEVAYGSVATEADRTLLAKVIDANAIHPDGSACDDKNALTINDKYTNGICEGITFKANTTITSDHYRTYFNYQCGSQTLTIQYNCAITNCLNTYYNTDRYTLLLNYTKDMCQNGTPVRGTLHPDTAYNYYK